MVPLRFSRGGPRGGQRFHSAQLLDSIDVAAHDPESSNRWSAWRVRDGAPAHEEAASGSRLQEAGPNLRLAVAVRRQQLLIFGRPAQRMPLTPYAEAANPARDLRDNPVYRALCVSARKRKNYARKSI